jgi:thiosulfate/3-mercaptopyruvate sulfurtransferase
MTSPLISVDTLAARLDDPRLRLVDTRWSLGKPGAGRAAYDLGHLPGAIHLDLDTDLAAHEGPGRHPLPEPRAFAARLAARGIGDGDTVVAYDDVGGWVAARLRWMLDNLGFERAFVLDGGIGAWTATGLPLSTEPVTCPPAERLSLGDRWTKVIERDDLRGRLGTVTLLDARGAPRYRGEVEPVDDYPGHIPTAHNRPTDRNLGPDGRFLARGALRAEFAPMFSDGADVVTSCGSGTSAAHHILATRVAGLPDPILYVGSYSDWSRSGYPVTVGTEPGSPEEARSPGDGAPSDQAPSEQAPSEQAPSDPAQGDQPPLSGPRSPSR